jgi:hypothetical protein
LSHVPACMDRAREENAFSSLAQEDVANKS